MSRQVRVFTKGGAERVQSAASSVANHLSWLRGELPAECAVLEMMEEARVALARAAALAGEAAGRPWGSAAVGEEARAYLAGRLRGER